jgi:hypothetical protein
MKHLSPKDEATRGKPSCRRGRHRYGPAQNVGGGILRLVCARCGAVSIDLRDATPVDDEARAGTDGWGGGRSQI